MAAMSADENITKLVDSVDIFVEGIASMISVFSGEYDGGDFCIGLIFGKYGSKMLTDIADTFLSVPDEHDPHKHKLK